jgi:hypothetical protein
MDGYEGAGGPSCLPTLGSYAGGAVACVAWRGGGGLLSICRCGCRAYRPTVPWPWACGGLRLSVPAVVLGSHPEAPGRQGTPS